jgi:hypothetical protein
LSPEQSPPRYPLPGGGDADILPHPDSPPFLELFEIFQLAAHLQVVTGLQNRLFRGCIHCRTLPEDFHATAAKFPNYPVSQWEHAAMVR